MVIFTREGLENSCSYVKAYFSAMGLRPGDTWLGYEYMAWIGRRHREFRKMHSIPEHRPYNDAERKGFEKWLQGYI